MNDIIVAAVAAIASVGGALVASISGIARNLLETRKLAQQMQETNQKLWQWNRELLDHIYRRLPPPPPPQPTNLFGDGK
jgi:predicted PurR-regulated permease PerM